MAPGLDIQRLGLVFQSRPDILEGIQREANSASRVTLFNDIASFVYEQTNGPEPAAKRRRVDVDASNGFKASNGNGTINVAGSVPASAAEAAVDEPVQLEIKEISVSVPQRKKFELCFTDNHLYARVPGTTTPAAGIAYAWGDIEYAFYLPIPEKTQVQHNYIIFPRGACLPSKTETAIPTAEPLVFTVPATAPKQGTILGPKASSAAAVSDTYRSLFDWALTTHLRAASNPINIVSADPAKFHSMVRQPHRPNEKAVHVKAFRGSKDGYLFFLPTGILWGFKKPLLFIPLERISSLSYTSVLQRTFNIVVEAFTGEGDATEELEFAMLDQEDYQGIDESYVKRNGLQDRSMAEQRRAKMELVENQKAGKKAAGAGDVAPEAGADTDGRTELEKAQAEAELQLQDEEDEDEEDYDPGSEGESEGSGVSSDEDDEDDDQEMEGGEDDEQDDAGDESINVKG
ncbi:Histone chaperone like protein [Verticillium longisporum]|uniref:Histone chaperone n=3 Tax=Verticillium TaxID=1036719 RepID=G2X0I7_VERDV|nr:histone chaperone [Verticillium dahliae VdLs.17]KAF3343827.1 F-box/LRR-repeat protein 14 [Verticillium dahliae VDG2]KAG7139533.1 Histone chaperone like protein [Verticillium longisporum]KAH6678979.1 histone chaperone [Verticillium dahliae]EGY22328.1 histone chaperone [Verticillium dahliae VdLs.17]KAH6704726.1 histone chaperone [Verticillium dahliae]